MNANATEAINSRVRVLVVSSSASPDSDSWESAWEVAGALARDHDVILALPEATSHTHADFAVIYYNQRNLPLVAKDSDAVVCEAGLLKTNSFFTSSGSIVAADTVRLKLGVLGGSEAVAAGQATTTTTDDSLVIWIPPEEKHEYGTSHYIKKLRYYMHKGGIRYTTRRALSALKRRLGSSGK